MRAVSLVDQIIGKYKQIVEFYDRLMLVVASDAGFDSAPVDNCSVFFGKSSEMPM